MYRFYKHLWGYEGLRLRPKLGKICSVVFRENFPMLGRGSFTIYFFLNCSYETLLERQSHLDWTKCDSVSQGSMAWCQTQWKTGKILVCRELTIFCMYNLTQARNVACYHLQNLEKTEEINEISLSSVQLPGELNLCETTTNNKSFYPVGRQEVILFKLPCHTATKATQFCTHNLCSTSTMSRLRLHYKKV